MGRISVQTITHLSFYSVGFDFPLFFSFILSHSSLNQYVFLGGSHKSEHERLKKHLSSLKKAKNEREREREKERKRERIFMSMDEY